MLKTPKGQTTLFVLVITFLFAKPLPAQNRPPENVKKTSKVVKPAATKPASSRDSERQKLAQEIVEELFRESRSVLNPVIRTKIRTLAAEAYWHFRPQMARQILIEELAALRSLETVEGTSEFWTKREGKTDYKGVPLAQVKDQLKRALLATASVYDVSFLQELLALASNKSESSQTNSSDPMDQQLLTAGDLAGADPNTSAELIQDSLQKGVDGSFSFALMKLRESSPARASQLFNQALGLVKTSGDLWQFQRLVPYILPSEMDRLVGGKHYLTDPQRMLDAKITVEYGSRLLYKRIQSEAPANMPPDLVRKEYYLWRSLQAVFEDIDPGNVWLVNTRLRQLASTLPPSTERRTEGPWTDDRLKTLLAAAEQSSGEKRDNYLSAAASTAWRFGEGDLDKAIALVEKISDPHLRDDMAGIFYLQAGTKYLRSEGPDYALELARKINLPGPRVRLFMAVISSLQGVKATERTESLRRELLGWLRSCERNSDTAWALLDYLEAPVSDVSDDRFAAFEILVQVLNSPTLDIKGGIKNRVYWYPEFHDFRKSLMALVKADFERTLTLIEMLNNREISMQVQAAFCANFLKLQSQHKNVTER